MNSTTPFTLTNPHLNQSLAVMVAATQKELMFNVTYILFGINISASAFRKKLYTSSAGRIFSSILCVLGMNENRFCQTSRMKTTLISKHRKQTAVSHNCSPFKPVSMQICVKSSSISDLEPMKSIMTCLLKEIFPLKERLL